ncbi:MAG: UDP-glucose--hexose-1-phosphate uridylyltransferase [Clostridia bacterium]|nr:UDP-glucose--hexose-1-phosphate uridylyltransferase [Clostridia bacterium]
MLYGKIKALTEYGVQTGLIGADDAIYVRNRLLEAFHEDDYADEPAETAETLGDLLTALCDEAVARGIIGDGITERDLFDTKLMGELTMRPSEVKKTFYALYETDPIAATDWFYKLCCDCNYIRRDRVAKDLKWVYSDARFGDIDITINLSKPEKDPKAIAAAKTMKQSGYPTCMLCKENIGYAGRMNFPARQNHRAVPMTINNADWFLQYSPYVYYNEHCIVFFGEHVPMKIEESTFRKLFDFVEQFPHYFLGSNADLPIVGGSILTHDHYQGGHYTFAMARANIEESCTIAGFEDVEAGILNWPVSVLRLRHKDPQRLITLASRVLDAWRGYTDEAAYIFAETDGEPHNTVTPIARCVDGTYELDLALRNNITTEQYPLGVYHPHDELHHIKKENIGLIEVMGLAVLPSRLKDELKALEKALLAGADLRADAVLEKHADWAEELVTRHPELNAENAEAILQAEVGAVFVKVLEDAGVYKCTPEGRAAFRKFIQSI